MFSFQLFAMWKSKIACIDAWLIILQYLDSINFNFRQTIWEGGCKEGKFWQIFSSEVYLLVDDEGTQSLVEIWYAIWRLDIKKIALKVV